MPIKNWDLPSSEDFVESLASAIDQLMMKYSDYEDQAFPDCLARDIASLLWQKTEPLSHKDLASFVWHVRGSLGLSQRAFAEQLGTHQVTVARWESGRSKPSPLYLRQLTALAQARLRSAASPKQQ